MQLFANGTNLAPQKLTARAGTAHTQILSEWTSFIVQYRSTEVNSHKSLIFNKKLASCKSITAKITYNTNLLACEKT